MSQRQKFYLTTPIYYINDRPHVGHAYTIIIADILARYQRMQGKEVFFLTGTDENSQKNVEAALASGTKDIQKYVDRMSAQYQQIWDSLDLTHNDFIRTTEVRHKKGVYKFFEAVYKKGDIYKGKYQGLYCQGCEAFLSEVDLVQGKCPYHQKKPQKLSETNYFFRASKYKKAILAHLKAHPEFLEPEARRKEMTNYIKDHFGDFSISRQSVKWGIPLPLDTAQVIYVWFDALINYLTGIGYGSRESGFKKFWPAELHLIGKDIIKFHAGYWPAMLMSAGLPLPRKIFAHGFFTIDGQKISKSLGNTINPLDLTARFGLDAVRYFLAREFPFGEDGDFSESRLLWRYNGDLANGLGNLVARVITLATKYKVKGQSTKIRNKEFEGLTRNTWKDYEKALESLQFHEALEIIWRLLKFSDGYVEETKPWQLAKTNQKKLAEVMYNLLESLRQTAWLILPFMPETSDRIFTQLGLDLVREKEGSLKEAKKWGGLVPGLRVKKGQVLFPRL